MRLSGILCQEYDGDGSCSGYFIRQYTKDGEFVDYYPHTDIAVTILDQTVEVKDLDDGKKIIVDKD